MLPLWRQYRPDMAKTRDHPPGFKSKNRLKGGVGLYHRVAAGGEIITKAIRGVKAQQAGVIG